MPTSKTITAVVVREDSGSIRGKDALKGKIVLLY
jgi:hypothetical protein